jgi:hypothetical protein
MIKKACNVRDKITIESNQRALPSHYQFYMSVRPSLAMLHLLDLVMKVFQEVLDLLPFRFQKFQVGGGLNVIHIELF